MQPTKANRENADSSEFSGAPFLDNYSLYVGRKITGYRRSTRRGVIEVEGLPPLTVVLASSADSKLREEHLRELFTLSAFSKSPPDLWTMSDLTWALNVPYSKRWCGQIGRHLKHLKMERRHHLWGLIDARTRKQLPACDVYSSWQSLDRRDITLDDIRDCYNRQQAKQRLLVCQSMRDSIGR